MTSTVSTARAIVVRRAKRPPRSAYDTVVAAQHWAIAHAAFVSLFLCVSVIGGSIFVEQVNDRVVVHRRSETLVILFTILVGLLVVAAILKKFRDQILERAAFQIDQAVRPALFAVRLRHEVQPRLGGKEALADLDTVRAFVGTFGFATIFDTVPLPVYIAACFLMHPAVGMTALIGSVFLAGLALLQIRQKALELKRRTAGVSGASFLIDTLVNIEAVQALGMRRVFRRRWLDIHRVELQSQSAMEDRAATLAGLSRLIGSLLAGSCMTVAAYLAISDEISPGNIFGAMILSSKLLGPVSSLTGIWPQVSLARAAHFRLRALFHGLAAEAPGADPSRPEGRIEVSGLTVMAPGSPDPILTDVTFAVLPGAVVAVVGPSGAGKSTLVRALTGIWAPGAGSIQLDGRDLQAWDPDELGPHIGYLPQRIELLRGTIAENISRFAPPQDALVLAAADLAGVHEVIQSLPEGYNSQVGEGGSSLSGGQRQRIGLARALYGNPSLVVLDEPNANLDAQGEAALAIAVAALKRRGATTFIITHKANILNLADKILVLTDGRVSAFGPRDEIFPKITGPRAVPQSASAAIPMPAPAA